VPETSATGQIIKKPKKPKKPKVHAAPDAMQTPGKKARTQGGGAARKPEAQRAASAGSDARFLSGSPFSMQKPRGKPASKPASGSRKPAGKPAGGRGKR
jgi:hypothetical protein